MTSPRRFDLLLLPHLVLPAVSNSLGRKLIDYERVVDTSNWLQRKALPHVFDRRKLPQTSLHSLPRHHRCGFPAPSPNITGLSISNITGSCEANSVAELYSRLLEATTCPSLDSLPLFRRVPGKPWTIPPFLPNLRGPPEANGVPLIFWMYSLGFLQGSNAPRPWFTRFAHRVRVMHTGPSAWVFHHPSKEPR